MQSLVANCVALFFINLQTGHCMVAFDRTRWGFPVGQSPSNNLDWSDIFLPIRAKRYYTLPNNVCSTPTHALPRWCLSSWCVENIASTDSFTTTSHSILQVIAMKKKERDGNKSLLLPIKPQWNLTEWGLTSVLVQSSFVRPEQKHHIFFVLTVSEKHLVYRIWWWHVRSNITKEKKNDWNVV